MLVYVGNGEEGEAVEGKVAEAARATRGTACYMYHVCMRCAFFFYG